MLAFSWFTWWYGRGWLQTALQIRSILIGISHAFSISILLKTLFAPWKRIITYPGASLDAKVRALMDNLVSRAVGATVRLLVLTTAFVMEVATLCVGLVVLIAWPLLPVACIALIIKGIIG